MVPRVAKKLEQRSSLPWRMYIPRLYLVRIARFMSGAWKAGWSGVSVEVSWSLKGRNDFGVGF